MDSNKVNHRLWFGNIDQSLREYQLLKLVEKYGPLTEFDYLYHKQGINAGKPTGYAFVTFKDLSSAKNAQDKLNGLTINGRYLKVHWAHEKDESKYKTQNKPVPSGLNIIEKSMSEKCSNEKLAALQSKLSSLENSQTTVDITADLGEAKQPTTVIYNVPKIKRRIDHKNYSYKRKRCK